MGGNIPISISPSSEESFFFCLLPHSLLSGSLCNFTDDTCHTDVTGHYLPNSFIVLEETDFNANCIT
jgi:hypothetical protein